MIRICFFCLGNICRSPTAEGVFRYLVREAGLEAAIEIDSAGTSAWHVGEPPDRRAIATARAHGIEVGGLARQLEPGDLDRFDYLIAMDRSNLRDAQGLTADETRRARLRLLRDFDPAAPRGSDVPDPYYGGEAGFEEVLAICRAACRGLLDELRRAHALDRS